MLVCKNREYYPENRLSIYAHWASFKRKDCVTFGRDTTNIIEGLNGYYKKLINRCTRMDDLVRKLLAASERKVRNLRRCVFNDRVRKN